MAAVLTWLLWPAPQGALAGTGALSCTASRQALCGVVPATTTADYLHRVTQAVDNHDLAWWATGALILVAALVARRSRIAAWAAIPAAFAGCQLAPTSSTSGRRSITGSHHRADFVFDLLGGLAVLFLVLFAVALARQVRTGDRWLAHGALAGAVFGGLLATMLWVLVAGIWMVKQGPPVPDRVTLPAENRVTA